MARFYPAGGAGGGTGSDECTAVLATDVVAGKTAVTSDSNDEAGTGGLADKNGTSQEATASLDTTNSRLQMAIPALGRYNTNSKLYAAYSKIRDLIGLTAAKIAVGVSILGITGTYKGKGDAVASQVLTGKKFSTASLSNATGTMADRTGWTHTFTPTTSQQNQTVPAGYHNGGYKVYCNAIPSKYVDFSSGKTVFNNGQFPASDIVSGFCSYLVGVNGYLTGDGTIYKTSITFNYAAIPGDSYGKGGLFAHSIDFTKISSISVRFQVTYALYDTDEDTKNYMESASFCVHLINPSTLKSTAYAKQWRNESGSGDLYAGDYITVTLDTSSVTGYQYVYFNMHITSVDDEEGTFKLCTVTINP